MKLATMNDFGEIKSIFAPFLKTYFPHIRSDYLQREIEKGNVVLDEGVVIIFNKYKRKQKIGNSEAEKDDVAIKQIVTASQGSGKAYTIAQQFFKEMNTNIWLTVRKENERARNFYKKLGMEEVGEISWASGSIPGVVYLYKGEQYEQRVREREKR